MPSTSCDLVIEIGGEIRFRGVFCRDSLAFLSEAFPDLPLVHPVGCLLTGMDVDRARAHGPLPVRIRRNGAASLTLGWEDAEPGAGPVLSGEGMAFAPSDTSIGRLLIELGV